MLPRQALVIGEAQTLRHTFVTLACPAHSEGRAWIIVRGGGGVDGNSFEEYDGEEGQW